MPAWLLMYTSTETNEVVWESFASIDHARMYEAGLRRQDMLTGVACIYGKVESVYA